MTPRRRIPFHLTYPLQRTMRAAPALGPGRVLLLRVPLGQSPSLRLLRRRLMAGLCSETSAVLRNCPTSHARSSSAYVLDFPDTACHQPQAVPWDLPVLEQDVSPCMHRVYDLARPNASRASDASAIAFRLVPRRRLLEERLFRGSIPGLHGPLSTLRLLLTQGYRMTRGRRGSLLLHRVAFFIPLHLAGLARRTGRP